MQVRLLSMLMGAGILLSVGSARAQDDGQAAASTSEPAAPSAQPPAGPPKSSRPGLLTQSADQEAIEFGKELRTVEEDVGNLKERVFRSKATLQLLRELLVDASAGKAQVAIWHVNELGGAYSMESVQYFLDGKNVFANVDPEGSLDDTREFKVHEQQITPGKHDLQVQLVLRGKGYRVFSYLESYQFKVQSSFAFEAVEASRNIIRAVTESKGALKSFMERPTIRYDARVESVREE